MNRLAINTALMIPLVLLLHSDTHAADGTTIPLDRIWAYEMPGTRDVRELEPKLDIHDPSFKKKYAQSRVRKIARFLATYVPARNERADPAFIVLGIGKRALKNASAFFTTRGMKEQERLLPKDTELSLVFFSYTTSWHPKIVSVEQAPGSITVKYQFIVPEQPAFGGKGFALIPIGELPEGETQVNIEQLPPIDYRGRLVPAKFDANRYVCDSFSFDVR